MSMSILDCLYHCCVIGIEDATSRFANGFDNVNGNIEELEYEQDIINPTL